MQAVDKITRTPHNLIQSNVINQKLEESVSMVSFEALFCGVAAHWIASHQTDVHIVLCRPNLTYLFMITSLLLLPSSRLIMRLICGDAETGKVVEEKQFFPFFSSSLIAVVSSLLPSHFRIQKHIKRKAVEEQVSVMWMQRQEENILDGTT